MSASETDGAAHTTQAPPPLRRDRDGELERSSLADTVEWFINHDARVNVIRHPAIEELFQWKQEQDGEAQEEIYRFSTAEDRLAVGIFQALAVHRAERELHAWITQLLGALDEASKTNMEISEAFRLSTEGDASTLAEAEKIPAAQMRRVYLTACWLEALCTAEIRVLGWVYQNLYNKPYAPEQR